MLIPDRALPSILDHAAPGLGAVLLSLAFDLDVADRAGFEEAARDNMSTHRAPKILADALSYDEEDELCSPRRIRSWWDASAGFEITLQIIEGEGEIDAWIVLPGNRVLHTRNVRSRPFALMDVRGGRLYHRD